MPATGLLSQCTKTSHGAFRPDAWFVASRVARGNLTPGLPQIPA